MPSENIETVDEYEENLGKKPKQQFEVNLEQKCQKKGEFKRRKLKNRSVETSIIVESIRNAC